MLRSGSGSNFIRRTNSLNFDAPSLQWTDRAARALIQRDQQSAEFAAGVRGGDRASLEALHARQRLEVGQGEAKHVPDLWPAPAPGRVRMMA